MSTGLDRYAEGLENLSQELQTKLAKLRDLNNKIHMIMKHTDRLIDEYLKNNFPSEKKKNERKLYIDSLFAKAKCYSDNKIVISNETYDIVDKYIIRLDLYLKRFANEIETRAEIIRNAPDHHSEERRLERDKKEAEEREEQKTKATKKEEKKNSASGHHRNKKTNEIRIEEANTATDSDDAEQICRSNTPNIPRKNSITIDNQLNNIHITEEGKSSTSKSRDAKKSSKNGIFTDKQSSTTAKDKKSTETVKQIDSATKPTTSNKDCGDTKQKCNKSENKSRNSHVNSSNSLTDRDDADDKTSVSSISNSANVKKCSESNQSDVKVHPDKPRRSKSSSSNHRRSSSHNSASSSKSSDVNSGAHKKANSNSSDSRIKSSSDQNLSFRNRNQKETKDTEKRKKVEKNTSSDEDRSKGAIKKRKVSTSSDEEEFDIPPEPDEPIYCFCQKVSYGQMVACDNKKCELVWFHFGCVGLKRTPPGKWFCRICKKVRRSGNNV